MKRWIWFCGFLAAVCCLSRLPHPAVDVGKLEPVSLVAVDWQDGSYHIRTDTGAEGSGTTLKQAAQSLAEGASGTVFLETAEYVLLTPQVPVTGELCQVFRPACRVCLTAAQADLEQAAAWLAAHPPRHTLNDLRAGERDLDWLEMEEVTDEAS